MQLLHPNCISAGFLALLLSIPCTILGQTPSYKKTLENRRSSTRDVGDFSLERQTALALLQADVPSLRISIDPVIGSPKFVRAIAGFIRPATGAAGEEEPTTPIKAFLDENRSLFGHGSEVLDNAQLMKQYVTERRFTTVSGMISTEWRQTLDGFPIFDATMAGHVTPTGDLITLCSQFIPNPRIASQEASPRFRLSFDSTPIGPESAIALAAAGLDEILDPETMRALSEKEIDPSYRKRFDGGGMVESSRIELGWIPISRTALRPCWKVTHFSVETSEMFFTYLDAATGKIYKRQTGTGHQSVAYKIYHGDSPTPKTPGHSTPLTTQPVEVNRITVTNSYSYLNWFSLTDNAGQTNTMTLGNNVDARIFLQDNPGAIPVWGEPLNPFIAGFDRPTSATPRPNLDFSQFNVALNHTPSVNREAAVVNAFYWTNWTHDRLEELGFDEAAGNFQQVNSSGQGIGGDALTVNVQYGFDHGFRNQNFNDTDPQDGVGPNRIRIGVFDGPHPDRDAAFDNEVLIHEYCHGLYRRLVGATGSAQSFGIEEATSDFMALSFLSSSSDPLFGGNAVYPVTGYMTKDLVSGGQTLTENYYYGIRTYPTSTYTPKSPITLKDMDYTQASSHPSVNRNPLYPPYNQPGREYEKAIDFWLAVLWEAHTNLVSQHLHSEGSYRMRQLVVDALKMVSPTPTFCEMRDAIIICDGFRFGGASYYQLWSAFAKRGLGYSAVCAGPDWFDVDAAPHFGHGAFTEAFDTP